MINTAALSGATPVAPTSTSLYPPSLSNANGMTSAAIAGIVVGVLVVPAFAMLALCFFKEKRRRRDFGELMESEKRHQSQENRVATSLVDIAEVAARKKAARERLEQLEKGENQKAEIRGALRT